MIEFYAELNDIQTENGHRPLLSDVLSTVNIAVSGLSLFLMKTNHNHVMS